MKKALFNPHEQYAPYMRNLPLCRHFRGDTQLAHIFCFLMPSTVIPARILPRGVVLQLPCHTSIFLSVILNNVDYFIFFLMMIPSTIPVFGPRYKLSRYRGCWDRLHFIL